MSSTLQWEQQTGTPDLASTIVGDILHDPALSPRERRLMLEGLYVHDSDPTPAPPDDPVRPAAAAPRIAAPERAQRGPAVAHLQPAPATRNGTTFVRRRAARDVLLAVTGVSLLAVAAISLRR
ncbi:MAG TPA: hypothetical protein VFW66_08760 [Gemmatimonadales bacterium]|nr:hypothetical protein [Gemmatimonadales bacterium]